MVEVHRALTRLALHLLAKRLRIASHTQAIRRGGRTHLQSFDDPDTGALRDSFLPAIAAGDALLGAEALRHGRDEAAGDETEQGRAWPQGGVILSRLLTMGGHTSLIR